MEGDPFGPLSGVAAARGTRWADAVARVCPLDKPWPFTERSRAIARRKVDDLGDSDEMRERLATVCEAHASHWWAMLRERAERDAG